MDVVFTPGQLVQVYRSNLDYTFKTEQKLLPKWSCPYRISSRLRNAYKLETLTGTPLSGEFSTQQLQAFIPREGTSLHEEQLAYMKNLNGKGPEESLVQEENDNEVEMIDTGGGRSDEEDKTDDEDKTDKEDMGDDKDAENRVEGAVK